MSGHTAWLVLLCMALAGCVYAYLGYPLLLLAWGRLRPRPPRPGDRLPTVSVICAAYNEAANIERKLRNTLALDYPRERLEVIVAADGCTDATESIAAGHATAGVRLLSLPRGGKMAALDAAVRAASGEVLLFTDANVLLDATALRLLVRHFADREVGGVGASKRLPGSGTATGDGEGLYWRYDEWVRRLETLSGSVFGLDGSCYAIRRSAYRAVANGAQADDLAISARVALQGARLVHEGAAVCREEAPAESGAELRRKIRVANHGMRALLDLAPLLARRPGYAFRLLSHKLARYLVPLHLLVLLACSLMLAPGGPLFLALLAGQAAFYALAAAGWRLSHAPRGRHALLRVPFYFILMNLAAAIATAELLRGRRRIVWTRPADLYTPPALRPSPR
jgi:cellulose synthase/poly-beta-1,6-N-acetylglucosamine synthase-like glycosyltransferase